MLRKVSNILKKNMKSRDVRPDGAEKNSSRFSEKGLDTSLEEAQKDFGKDTKTSDSFMGIKN